MDCTSTVANQQVPRRGVCPTLLELGLRSASRRAHICSAELGSAKSTSTKTGSVRLLGGGLFADNSTLCLDFRELKQLVKFARYANQTLTFSEFSRATPRCHNYINSFSQARTFGIKGFSNETLNEVALNCTANLPRYGQSKPAWFRIPAWEGMENKHPA